MLEFKTCPIKNHPYMGQSLWIIDFLKKYFDEKHDGFLVEIGVGHVLDWRTMCNGGYSPREIEWNKVEDWDKDNIVRGFSHTIDLLENGWTGIYIDPISEFIDNELIPLLKKLLPADQFEKIKMVRCGASDKKRVLKIVGNETLGDLAEGEPKKADKVIPYQYYNRKVVCENTSKILSKNDCPSEIDFMIIDVEGLELQVLNGLDFSKYSPKLLLIEVALVPLDQIINALPDNYILAYNDGLNGMFIRSDVYIP